jgi:hypothetical protein
MEKQIVKPKATTVVGLNLCKHAHENRFLMCWYVLTIKGQKLNFRASEFVPEKVEDQLSELHCTMRGKKLLDNVKKLLLPYLNDICKQALEFLALPKEKQLELARSEDKFENPAYIDYN